VIVTRPDQGVEEGALDSASSKGSEKTGYRKHGATLSIFILLSEDLCPKICHYNSYIFVQMIREFLVSFRILFHQLVQFENVLPQSGLSQ